MAYPKCLTPLLTTPLESRTCVLKQVPKSPRAVDPETLRRASADHLAARLARDGDPEPIDIEETDSNFAIGWKGIEGEAFVSIDRDSGRVVTILGYATDQIAELG
ncbi:MAG: hypothetical protein ABSH05_27450 [Bryobacteraceae bacterium]